MRGTGSSWQTKVAEGYAFDTLKNLKWGLSSVFSAAVKYGYVKSNPVCSAELPPEGVREEATLPTASELGLLIAALPEPLATAVWLVAITCIRPEELAFKGSDLDVGKRQLWIMSTAASITPRSTIARTVPFN